MAEYIDRQALLVFANNHKGSTIDANDIARFPAADVVEVRHGTWLDAPDNGKPVPFDEHYNEGCVPQYSCYCSVCGEWLTASDEYAVIGRYCPYCGAKMDGVTDTNVGGKSLLCADLDEIIDATD